MRRQGVGRHSYRLAIGRFLHYVAVAATMPRAVTRRRVCYLVDEFLKSHTRARMSGRFTDALMKTRPPARWPHYALAGD